MSTATNARKTAAPARRRELGGTPEWIGVKGRELDAAIRDLVDEDEDRGFRPAGPHSPGELRGLIGEMTYCEAWAMADLARAWLRSRRTHNDPAAPVAKVKAAFSWAHRLDMFSSEYGGVEEALELYHATARLDAATAGKLVAAYRAIVAGATPEQAAAVAVAKGGTTAGEAETPAPSPVKTPASAPPAASDADLAGLDASTRDVAWSLRDLLLPAVNGCVAPADRLRATLRAARENASWDAQKGEAHAELVGAIRAAKRLARQLRRARDAAERELTALLPDYDEPRGTPTTT